MRVVEGRRAFTNWFGQSVCVGLGKIAFSRMVAVVWLIWLSMSASCPLPSELRAVAAAGLDRRARPRPALCDHARQVVLRQREEDRDRIELRDDDDAGRVGGVHEVARVDQAHAGHAVDRRGDARVVELQLRVLDLRLVGLHVASSCSTSAR